MRITNKMMSGNSLANINNNKQYLDKLNNQMATEKKITRPSDDPIIAIRALRLRSELSELTQYYGANVPDAQAWVSVTQSAIASTKDILSSLKAYADQGANGTNTAADRQKIYDNMSYMRKQVYQNGNVTNAGRSVFTGYRTSEALTFKEDTVADYRGINDGFNASDVATNTYISTPYSMDSINSLDIGARAAGDVAEGCTFTIDGKDYFIRKIPDEYEGRYPVLTVGDYQYFVFSQNLSIEKSTLTGTVIGVIGTATEVMIATIDGTDMAVEKNAEGHYDPVTIGDKVYEISDEGIITTANEGDIEVKENKVNRIRLSYDNLDTTVKRSYLGRYSGDQVGTISNWGGAEDWEKYFKNGQITSDGKSFSDDMTIDGKTVTLKLDPKGDQTLNPNPPLSEDFYDLYGRLREDSTTYGGYARNGNVYATRCLDETKVIYRHEMDEPAKVPLDSIVKHPVDGLQMFEIRHDGETYIIKKFDDGNFWAVNSAGDIQANMDIDVIHNTDGTFTVKVPTDDGGGKQGFRPYYDSLEWNVYNISADARSVISCYHESVLQAKIVTSDEVVAKDKTGKELTAYEYLALDPNNNNSDIGATRVDEEDISPDSDSRHTPADSVYLLADTGELVFGSEIADKLSSLKDIPGVDTISVVYDKSNYKEGDVRPEHYFNVNQMDENHMAFNPIVYDDAHQAITYTIGTNQNIKINTNADEVFDTQIAREMDDIMNAIEEYNAVEAKVDRLKEMQNDKVTYGEEAQAKIKVLLDAANKELDYAKNKLQRTYEDAITQFNKFFDQANQAETACGTIDSRLTLVSNRLSEEKTTVTTLASENENVDITNIAVEVSEANLVYNAALMATGRISQQTLVDYI